MKAGNSAKANIVLIVSDKEDIHARVVAHRVKDLGGEAVTLDLHDFPFAWQLTWTLTSQGPSFRIGLPNRDITHDQVSGIWWRRPRRPFIPLAVRDPEVRQFCVSEATSFIYGWLNSLGGLVVNSPATESAANDKLYQLCAAAKCGLSIPETLISNSPQDTRSFQERGQRDTIFKILTNTRFQFTETRILSSDYLAQLDSLQFSPAIFQELIKAESHLRTTVIGHNCYTVEIKAQSEFANVDWRLDGAPKIQEASLPREVEEQLIQLHDHLGLSFGCCDLIKRPSGEIIFLESNPAGQFLFAEIHGDQPISKALASRLLNCHRSNGSPSQRTLSLTPRPLPV